MSGLFYFELNVRELSAFFGRVFQTNYEIALGPNHLGLSVCRSN